MYGIDTLIWFFVALGLLVTFHEFGHFWVARKCGVKVLRFSVGFGKPLFTWRDKSGTEFTLAAIPLGGYVKMLDEREGEVPKEELHQAFTQKTVWQRIAIVFAGPLANFILAIFLFWAMIMPGSKQPIPFVGAVESDSIAELAGLEVGQEIIAVDGVETPTWQLLNQQLLHRLGESGSLEMTVRYPDSDLSYSLEVVLDDWLKGVEEPDPLQGLGLTLYRPADQVVIEQVLPGEPAELAGLQSGDKVLSSDGIAMQSWSDWVEYVRARPEQTIALVVERRGQRLRLEVTPHAERTDAGETIGRVGASGQYPAWPEDRLREYRYGLFDGFLAAVKKTWDTSYFVLVSVKKLILGEISTKNLSGPVTIAKVAGETARLGWEYYVSFLALFSVSVGVFNLLPIPPLDGGHLLCYFIEVIKGSPVPERVQMIGYQAGLFIVVGVMILALYNDFMRL